MRERGSVGAGDVLEKMGYDRGGERARVFLLDVGPSVGGRRVPAGVRVYGFRHSAEEALGQAECHEWSGRVCWKNFWRSEVTWGEVCLIPRLLPNKRAL